jgi:Ca2+-binding EF-hand superfamily protein
MKTFVVASLLALAPLAAFAADPGPAPGGPPNGMFKKWDTNGDGVVTKEEAQAASADNLSKRFDQMDLNKDGQLTPDEISKAHDMRRTAMREKFAEQFKSADKNGDGGLSKEEAAAMPRIAEHFDELDTNKDGIVTQEELQAHHQHWRGRHQAPASTQS